ncbi:Riboflavin transporter MCH5 [Elsinoe australis]|uniref:Riboflavin transporter MCH5 n=1 Tax=Elsinoe australis TaxID=40998 RepID=A0A2P7YGK2_9PEZI|nr:Riboflavin transporter MCH5 [Elsinoe australis]
MADLEKNLRDDTSASDNELPAAARSTENSTTSHEDNKDVERNAPAAAPQSTPTPTTTTKPEIDSLPSGPAKNVPTANDAGSIPDGGLQAWLQVAGGFSLFFNTWYVPGSCLNLDFDRCLVKLRPSSSPTISPVPVFQTYYESGQLFQETSSNIAWIGAIQSFLVLAVSTLAGPLFDRGYLRLLLVTGSFLVVFGYMMLSLCTEFWQCLLAQGFCVGLGGGMLFVPAVAILPTYFKNKLGLAVGVAASGSSMGGVIYPIVFYRLVNQIGYAWATRVIGFIALATLIVPCTVMKLRVKPGRVRSLVDLTAFTDWPYVLFVLGTFVGYCGLYVMFFYISFYGQARGITSTDLSFYLVPILNAGSTLGRTVPNAISDKTGPLNILFPGALVCGALIFGLVGVNTVGGIVAIAVLFGFFSGVFIALPPVCIAVLTKDKSRIGTRIGMAFGVLAFAVLIGGPGGGGILGGGDPADLNFTGLWAFGGCVATASSLVILALRIQRAGVKLAVKV